MPPLPSLTPTWHNDTYQAIAPSQPQLSAAGKTIIITGAGSGIGRQTALSFAQAAAAHLILVGRDEAKLKETASHIPASTSTSVFSVDVTREDEVRQFATSIQDWDVLILAAGFISTPGHVSEVDISDFWRSFEVNVKGPMILIHALLPVSKSSRPTVLGLTSAMGALPAAAVPQVAPYIASKLAFSKIIEYLAVEAPKVFAASVHPGMVETSIFLKCGQDPKNLPMDKVQLPADFLVWMASLEASFLNGRCVWANWDVQELKDSAATLEASNHTLAGINGWPFPHM